MDGFEVQNVHSELFVWSVCLNIHDPEENLGEKVSPQHSEQLAANY